MQRGPANLAALLSWQAVGAHVQLHACILRPSGKEANVTWHWLHMRLACRTPTTARPDAAGAEGLRQDTHIWSCNTPAAQPVSLRARLSQLPDLRAAYGAAKLASERCNEAGKTEKRLQARLQWPPWHLGTSVITGAAAPLHASTRIYQYPCCLGQACRRGWCWQCANVTCQHKDRGYADLRHLVLA